MTTNHRFVQQPHGTIHPRTRTFVSPPPFTTTTSRRQHWQIDQDNNDNDTMTMIQDCYVNVAVADPEWFQTHIVSLLGPEEAHFWSAVVTTNRTSRTTTTTALSPPTNERDDPPIERSDSDMTMMTTTTSNAPSQVPPETKEEKEEEPTAPPLVVLSNPTLIVPFVNATATTTTKGTTDIVTTNTIPTTTGSYTEDDNDTAILLHTIREPEEEENVVVAKLGNETVPHHRVVLYDYSDDDDEKEEGTTTTRPPQQQVALSVLEQLGYTESDVQRLLPLALHIIRTDQIPKPKTGGLPTRWLRRDQDDSIQIVNATVLLSSSSSSLDHDILIGGGEATTNTAAPEFSVMETPDRAIVPPPTQLETIPNVTTTGPKNLPRTFVVGPDRTVATSSSLPPPQTSSPRVASTQHTQDSIDRPLSSVRRQRRSSREDDDPLSPRTVYNGRSTTGAKRRDTIPRNDRPRSSSSPPPPPPKSGPWPDVPTFQKLLREEATFRLRILGNDWTSVIKEEIDWRNDVYTMWLRTLQNGIGEPFISSRSDRLRRSSPPPVRRRDDDDDVTTTNPRKRPK